MQSEFANKMNFLSNKTSFYFLNVDQFSNLLSGGFAEKHILDIYLHSKT